MRRVSNYFQDDDNETVSVYTMEEVLNDNDGPTEDSDHTLRFTCVAQHKKGKTPFSMTFELSKDRDTVSYFGGTEFASHCLTDLQGQALERAVGKTVRQTEEFMREPDNRGRVHVWGPTIPLLKKKDEIRARVQTDVIDFRLGFQVSLLRLCNDMVMAMEKHHAKPPSSPLMQRILSWSSSKFREAASVSPTGGSENYADDEQSSD
ncbi:hypothetical protein NCC49_004794 [Naganishia albida]|nr:hypothetical protein NCC49_004794 [Naganishia albida]